MKIGKSCLLIFIMSIISFILAVLCSFGAIAAFVFSNKLSEFTEAELSDIDGIIQVGAVFLMIGMFLILAIAIGAAVITVILGIFGMICARQNGKFSLGCLIMGGIPALFTALTIARSLLYGSFEPIMFPIFAYFGLYTAGAVIAYIEKRNCGK